MWRVDVNAVFQQPSPARPLHSERVELCALAVSIFLLHFAGHFAAARQTGCAMPGHYLPTCSSHSFTLIFFTDEQCNESKRAVVCQTVLFAPADAACQHRGLRRLRDADYAGRLRNGLRRPERGDQDSQMVAWNFFLLDRRERSHRLQGVLCALVGQLYQFRHHHRQHLDLSPGLKKAIIISFLPLSL